MVRIITSDTKSNVGACDNYQHICCIGFFEKYSPEVGLANFHTFSPSLTRDPCMDPLVC
jgi:hypothetical protein